MLPAIEYKLDQLPSRSGVYVFRDGAGQVLYVGKAASLRSRVRSYFQPSTSDQRFFIERLSEELGDIETFVTDTEKEAALLENSLIKEHRPRYNVKLRDDKEFLSLRLDSTVPWARLEVVRKPTKDGARYFGPYHSASSARSMLRMANRHFQLRTCTDAEMQARKRPCLQYQIKRCLAPCVLEVDRAAYDVQARNVGLFLEGRYDELKDGLVQGMTEASAAMKYELAASYRDQIRAVESTAQTQRVSLVTDDDQDVFGFHRVRESVEIAVLIVRRGKVVSVRTFDLNEMTLPDDELIASFVGEYYARGSYVPNEVLVPVPVEAAEGLASMLSEQRGSRVEILQPQRGNKARLLAMAMDNAAHAYREKARSEEEQHKRLTEVASRLGLPKLPVRFECIDVSHTAGTDTVAAIVAFKDGEPDRRRYKSFHVRGVSGGDDYGAMHEVLGRRIARAQRGEKGWELPDLLVVDGGKGQLAIALAVLQSMGVTDLPVAALAKEKENALGHTVVDRVYMPGRKNAVEVREHMRSLGMLAHARDEAHRVSNALRTKLGAQRNFSSPLETIHGIGPKTRRALLKTLGSLEAIAATDVDGLVTAGATRRQAEAVYGHFHGVQADFEAAEESAVDSAFDAESPNDP